MSMTYYAVTDDPNELAHFGILGMKWGRRRTPEQLGHPRHKGSRKRSPAYKKAQSKLGKMMKSGIKKAEAHWKEYNSPKAKEERFMKKAMQQARTGTLKYGKLTDAQVRKVTERLALERNARQLGSTENPRYSKRLKMAIGEGIIRGIGQGTGAYIEERFRGRGRTTAEIKADKRKAKYETSIAGRVAQGRKVKAAQREEFLKVANEEGLNFLDRNTMTARERANYLAEVKKRNRESDYRAEVQKEADKQYARARAIEDSKNKTLEYNAIWRQTAAGQRRLKPSGALKELNDWNREHEYENYKGNLELTDAERKRIDSENTSNRRKKKRKGRS